jgi:hypothetical protein
LAHFYCKCVNPNEAQKYIEFTNPRNKMKYLLGNCRHCKKHFVISDGERLEGKAAKYIFEQYKGKLKRKIQSDKFISKTDFNNRFFSKRKKTIKKTIKNKDKSKTQIIEKYQYQIECYLNGDPAKKYDPIEKIDKYCTITNLQLISTNIKQIPA